MLQEESVISDALASWREFDGSYVIICEDGEAVLHCAQHVQWYQIYRTSLHQTILFFCTNKQELVMNSIGHVTLKK